MSTAVKRNYGRIIKDERIETVDRWRIVGHAHRFKEAN